LDELNEHGISPPGLQNTRLAKVGDTTKKDGRRGIRPWGRGL
jgi:hypothetical protein